MLSYSDILNDSCIRVQARNRIEVIHRPVGASLGDVGKDVTMDVRRSWIDRKSRRVGDKVAGWTGEDGPDGPSHVR